jgi:hypothetical protein
MTAGRQDDVERTGVSPDETLLRAGLADVFEQARSVVSGWLANEGLPPVMPRWRMVVEENETGNGWSGHHVEVNENVLTEGLVEIHMASQKVLTDWMPAALAIAEKLQERFSNTRPLPFPFRPPRLGLIGVDVTSSTLRPRTSRT